MWRQHWDFQLYKALEVQYLAGLEMINKTLPEVGRPEGWRRSTRAWASRRAARHVRAHPLRPHHQAVPVPAHPRLSRATSTHRCTLTVPQVEIKMVFRQHRLQYDPPLEELRIRHVKELLNTFLGLPLRMKVRRTSHATAYLFLIDRPCLTSGHT